MSERDNETFDLDDEFLAGPPEDGTDYDRLLDRVDKRVRNQGKRGKAAWSRLEEVLADQQARERPERLRRRAVETSAARRRAPISSARGIEFAGAPSAAGMPRRIASDPASSAWIVLKFGGTSVSSSAELEQHRKRLRPRVPQAGRACSSSIPPSPASPTVSSASWMPPSARRRKTSCARSKSVTGGSPANWAFRSEPRVERALRRAARDRSRRGAGARGQRPHPRARHGERRADGDPSRRATSSTPWP